MPVPGQCKHERTVLMLSSDKPKSCCTVRGYDCWTNCREMNHCVWETIDEQLQLMMLGYDDDEEDENL